MRGNGNVYTGQWYFGSFVVVFLLGAFTPYSCTWWFFQGLLGGCVHARHQCWTGQGWYQGSVWTWRYAFWCSERLHPSSSWGKAFVQAVTGHAWDAQCWSWALSCALITPDGKCMMVPHLQQHFTCGRRSVTSNLSVFGDWNEPLLPAGTSADKPETLFKGLDGQHLRWLKQSHVLVFECVDKMVRIPKTLTVVDQTTPNVWIILVCMIFKSQLTSPFRVLVSPEWISPTAYLISQNTHFISRIRSRISVATAGRYADARQN